MTDLDRFDELCIAYTSNLATDAEIAELQDLLDHGDPDLQARFLAAASLESGLRRRHAAAAPVARPLAFPIIAVGAAATIAAAILAAVFIGQPPAPTTSPAPTISPVLAATRTVHLQVTRSGDGPAMATAVRGPVAHSVASADGITVAAADRQANLSFQFLYLNQEF